MKLELKHLAPYLPYGLKYQLKGNFPIEKWKENIIEEIQELTVDYVHKVLTWDTCKPILHPLSDFNEEYKIQIIEEDFYGDDGHMDHLVEVIEGKVYAPSIGLIITYEQMQKLFEWHFDVFNLIPEGLAIDINTIES